MDLRQLEILRAVAQTGSFTSAGQQLHLSQSAVSRQILLLEEELKEQLFLRLGRKIRITPAGTTLLGLSERMFEDLERTRDSILAVALLHTFFNRSNNTDGIAADFLVGTQRTSAALLAWLLLTVVVAVAIRRQLGRDRRRELDATNGEATGLE